MAYVITAKCVDVMDRSCLTQCPVDCISQGERMLYIDPESCIDCGACEAACPTLAIGWEPTLTDEQRPFADINSEFFTSGIAEGADHPVIAALPRA